MPTFSIITANLNSGEKLAGTAASVLAQSADFEYLIMDGASTDRSIEIARQLAHDHPGKVRLVSKRDHGAYDAMNRGINASRGRYLYFLGAGDVLLAEALADIAAVLPADENRVVYGDVQWGGKRYDGPFSRWKLIKGNICHQAIFYGRGVFERLGLYSLRYRARADWEFNMRCFGPRGVRCQYTPVVVAVFEEGGFSSLGDSAFTQDKDAMIRTHLGLGPYLDLKWSRFGLRVRSKLSRIFRAVFQQKYEVQRHG